MKKIIDRITSGWNAMKALRVLAGVLVAGSGIADNNVIFVVIGSGFVLLSLLTPGVCCMAYTPPPAKKAATGLENVEYEELGSK